MQELGRALFILGIVLAGFGLVLWKLAGRTPLGRLPGDILIQKPNATFYFPVATCILVSVILSLLMWLFRR